MNAGRNDPCPCGSGRKYKKCHYAADTAPASSATSDVTSPYHELDNRLVADLATYASSRFPQDFADALDGLDSFPDMNAQLGGPLLVYVCKLNGRRVVDWFLEERGWSLSTGARQWLEWQQKSWLSIWEVIEVHPGRGLVLRDLLSHEERTVHEVSASKMVEARLTILARVVDTGPVSLICGMHPNPLRPMHVGPILDEVRRRLRRKTAIPIDRLREERIAWTMLSAWSHRIEELADGPSVTNTDGDPLLLTEERWTFDPGRRGTVVEAIAGIDGAEREESDDREVFAIVRDGNRVHKEWSNTLVATVEIRESTLRTKTNSVARADAIRVTIERVCQGLLSKSIRTHIDPTSPSVLNERSASGEPSPSTPEQQQVIRSLKERHYQQWLDDSIPALGGKTPRQAAKTRSGRDQLELLISDIELLESRIDPAARFDVRQIREQLGLV